MICRATPNVELVFLANIRIDGETQPRAEIDETLVGEYADEMTMETKFPPVVLFFDGADYWLADGFHRYHAARQVRLEKIEAEVHQGTREDAQWFSCSANRAHGLRRSNTDKRRAVQKALVHSPAISDRRIAEHVGVGHPLVAQVRSELGATGSSSSSVFRTTGKDGKARPVKKKPKKDKNALLGTAENPYPADMDYPGQIDDEQQEVPEELWEVFRHRNDFSELALRCRTMAGELEQLGNEPWGECYDALPDVAALKDIAGSISAARPSVLSENEARSWLPVREVE